jgi:hypothetical protein
MDSIARLLFPRLSPGRRRRELWRLILAVGLGLVLAVLVGLILYLLNLQHRI